MAAVRSDVGNFNATKIAIQFHNLNCLPILAKKKKQNSTHPSCNCIAIILLIKLQFGI